MGDGSLLMRASEMTVAVEHGLAPIYVAWMDRSLTQIEIKQRRQELRPVGVRLPEVSCAKIAEAFGGVGIDVLSASDFATAFSSALRSRAPTLIGAQVDQSRRAEWFDLLRG
jgi:acetolactate synthase-1/2/3 large subunit